MRAWHYCLVKSRTSLFLRTGYNTFVIRDKFRLLSFPFPTISGHCSLLPGNSPVSWQEESVKTRRLVHWFSLLFPRVCRGEKSYVQVHILSVMSGPCIYLRTYLSRVSSLPSVVQEVLGLSPRIIQTGVAKNGRRQSWPWKVFRRAGCTDGILVKTGCWQR